MQKLLAIIQSPTSLMILSFFFLFFNACAPAVLIPTIGSFDIERNIVISAFLFYNYIWFLIIPFITNKILFQQTTKSIGLCLPKFNWSTLLSIIFALVLLVPWIIYFGHRPEFKGYAHGHPTLIKFFCMQLLTGPIFYFAEEFFFRGFVFLNLWKKVRWHSFWITDIFFTLSHIGKPPLEILMCIPASVVFNFLTLQSKSILPAAFVHTTLGIILNYMATYYLV